MLTIHKYTLPKQDNFSLQLPLGAKLLTFKNQREEWQLWCLVNPDRPTEERKFRISGTGHEINDTIKSYIGTDLFYNGSLVFHLFELE